MKRRSFLKVAANLAIAGASASALSARAIRLDENAPLVNPCLKLSDALRQHPLTLAAFEGLRMEDVWDCHAHLLGKGHGDTGAFVSPKMQSAWPIWQLRQYVQYRFYLGAACVTAGTQTMDRDYIARFVAIMDELPPGFRAMLMAFDRTHDVNGKPVEEQSAFYLPNAYAARVAAANPSRLLWTASIHPYRADAAEEVAKVVAAGAVAVKWLPPAMGIDPASAKCDKFYEAMAKFDLPLITHGGEEKAVEGAHQPLFGNVLKLRRPLDRGVRVVVAHCASLGRDLDLDKGANAPEVSAFSLFERLMADQTYEGRLFGDISATPQANRFTSLAQILAHREWGNRLLNGSDYPLPGVFPLFSVDSFVERGWITREVGAHLQSVRQANPILFDFLLKRHLRIEGAEFPAAVFETARVFRRGSAAGSADPSQPTQAPSR